MSQSELDIARKRLRPKVYSLSLYIVAFLILVQLVALGSIFWLRDKVVSIESAGPQLKLDEKSLMSLEKKNVDEHALEASQVVSNTESTNNILTQLNQQARELRRNQEWERAEEVLRDALKISSTNTTTLINLAMLKEAKGDALQALTYWRQVADLANQPDSTVRLARERVSVIEEKLRQEKLVQAREAVLLRSRRKIVLDRVVMTPSSLPMDVSKLQVDFSLKVNQVGLDPSKMRVQIFVYDRVAGGDLVPAKVNARFLNAQPKWVNQSVEVLRVNYDRAQQENWVNRAYFGYVVRLIYDNQVQDERADPIELLTIFPFNG